MAKTTHKDNIFMNIFYGAFYGSLGGIAALVAVTIFSLIFIVPGIFIIKKYNKEDTKPLEKLQNEQYLGAVLCLIGILPWFRYLFLGFGFEAGESLFNNLLE